MAFALASLWSTFLALGCSASIGPILYIVSSAYQKAFNSGLSYGSQVSRLGPPFVMNTIIFMALGLVIGYLVASAFDKKANYPVKVSRIEISPNPVVSGEPATFKISATSGQAIYGGEVVIGVSYVGIPVHTESIDLCNEVACLVRNGNFLISHTETLPSITPPK